MKPIIVSPHAYFQCAERGTDVAEIELAIRTGTVKPAKNGRLCYSLELRYETHWSGRFFMFKRVEPIVIESSDAFDVITVYTYYY